MCRSTRRTLLLSREANTRATLDFPQEVERAHNVAIAGTEWIFDKGEDDLERAVSVLAGLAMLTTQGREDAIRKFHVYWWWKMRHGLVGRAATAKAAAAAAPPPPPDHPQ